MMWNVILGGIGLGGVLGWCIGYVLNLRKSQKIMRDLESRFEGEEDRMRSRTRQRAQKRQEHFQSRHDEACRRLERDQSKWSERRERAKKQRDQVDWQHRQLDKSHSAVRQRQKIVRETKQKIQELTEEKTKILLEQRQKIQEDIGLSEVDLRQEHLSSFEHEVVRERQKWIRQKTEEIKETRNELAEDFIDMLISRLQLKPTVQAQSNRFRIKEKSFGAETFVEGSPVVKKIEELYQVEFQFQEDPRDADQVTISAYDGVARERAMKLVDYVIRNRKTDLDWIEKQHEQLTRRLDREMTRGAGDLLRRLKIEGVDVNVVRLQGKIRFRTSFGQNVLDHQLEVGFLCGLLTTELGGFDLFVARQCGFFHDIGKAIDVVQEGSHPELGGDFLKKHGAREEVVHAAYMHHDPFDAENLYTAITTACDAMSASRPGARRESIDSYVERVESLEKLAKEPKGISTVAVMHAGREIQVNVDSGKVSDNDLGTIGEKIANRIEEELVYPGEIRVHVVRETNVRVVAH